MNNTPTNYTPPESPSRMGNGDNSRLRRALKTNRTYATVTIILSLLLCVSMTLNVAFIIGGRGENGTETLTGTNTRPPITTGSTPAQSTNPPAEHTSPADTTLPVNSDSEAEPIEPVELGQIIDLLSDEAKTMLSRVPDVYETLTDLVKEENRPNHVEYESDSEDVSSETDSGTSTEEEKKNPIYSVGEVSFAYVDLTTGEAFGYEADKPRYTASIVKAPYILSILREVEEFEQKKHNFADDGTSLYDENGKELFKGTHPNYDADGNIIYKNGEEKYDLSRKWVYNSKTMYVKGSGKILDQKDGFTLTYLELIEYALKYSDNIALEQLSRVFGYEYYHSFASELGISSKAQGFMHLSAADSIKFLCEMYNFFETGSRYSVIMKNAMINSNYGIMIPSSVSPSECAHKYGWDVDAYHDIGIVFHERPFAVAVMTNLDTGSYADYTYIQKIVKAMLKYHINTGVIGDTDTDTSDTQGDNNG